MRRLTALAIAMALSGAGAASAATINPWQVISHANAVIFGSATSQADIEGQAIIGGSFSGATIYNNPIATPYDGGPALTVFGAIGGNSININNGGSAYVAGAKGAPVNFNGGGGYVGAPSYAMADLKTAMNSFSAQLSTLIANSYFPTPGNNEVIEAKPVGGVAVFNISVNDLTNMGSYGYQFDLNGAKTVIVNVSGSTLSNFAANEQFNDSPFSSVTGSVIWNFYQATNLTFGTQIAGTILAPGAAVTNYNQIDGSVIAATLNAHGELHDNLYAYANVPEPATWGMMVLGVAGIGASLRRQRRRAAAA